MSLEHLVSKSKEVLKSDGACQEDKAASLNKPQLKRILGTKYMMTVDHNPLTKQENTSP